MLRKPQDSSLVVSLLAVGSATWFVQHTRILDGRAGLSAAVQRGIVQLDAS